MKRVNVLWLGVAFLTGIAIRAQEVGIGTTAPSVRLDIYAPAAYTSDLLRVLHGTNTYFIVANSGNVGVGAASPQFRLHVANDGMIYAEGTYGSGTDVPPGAKTAFIWNPKRGALRAGSVIGTQWDALNVGDYSVAFGYNTTASGSHSFVGGGGNNIAGGDSSFVGGGWGNAALGRSSVVVGGYQDTAGGWYSFVGGGGNNIAGGDSSFVGGGWGNAALSHGSIVVGGFQNTALGFYSIVVGGYQDSVIGSFSFIGGGFWNSAGGTSSVVVGGEQNKATGASSFVGGGEDNSASGLGSCIVGGMINQANGQRSVVGGGWVNQAFSDYSTVSGGYFNIASGIASTITGGSNNRASGDYAIVGGGNRDTASGQFSAVLGGVDNHASGNYSTICGGDSNTAGGNFSWVGGHRMKLGISAHRTFAWGYDASASPTIINTSDAFLIGPVGNTYRVGINLSSPTYALQLPNNSATSVGQARANAWTTYSDRRIKSEIEPVEDALSTVLRLRPVHYFQHNSWWNPKTGELVIASDGVYNYGFIAQELYDVLPEVAHKPEDPSKDLWGVDYTRLVPILTAAVQELSRENETLRAKVSHLESLEARIAALEAVLQTQHLK